MNFAASESESNTEEDLSEDEGPSVPGWYVAPKAYYYMNTPAHRSSTNAVTEITDSVLGAAAG